MVFENASIQTMLLSLNKDSLSDNYSFDYRYLNSPKADPDQLVSFVKDKKVEGVEVLKPTIVRKNFRDRFLTFSSDKKTGLLAKIAVKQNFNLREKNDTKRKLKSELGQGIVSPQDCLNKTSARELEHRFPIGSGIFVLSNEEIKGLNLSPNEKLLAKPYYTSEQLHRYAAIGKNSQWILYTVSSIGKVDVTTKKRAIDSLPNIKRHLDQFSKVITSDNKPYGLHRAREQHLFEGEKIMVQRKCVGEPVFVYTDFPCYVSQTYYIIQSGRIDLKYLTGLLNSSLIAFWLKNRGKMQGNIYQVDKAPILAIPIFKPENARVTKIAEIVGKIIKRKKSGGDTAELENRIDQMVYKLYDLTPEEIAIIEG